VVSIRRLSGEEIALLERQMPRLPGVHRQRFEGQGRGEGEYLIAWEGDRPVGHLFVEWDGTRREAVRSAMPDCPPNLSDIAVHPARQSRGIGSRLMEAAESLAARRGYERVGLSVALDNVRARALYERRGYVDAGLGPHQAGYRYLDRTGREQWHDEQVTYLVKRLDRRGLSRQPIREGCVPERNG
jgi:ribosomal protein S18 acetylase RimI-like enzyme